MSFIRTKTIRGHDYLYIQESKRIGKGVYSRHVKYIGKGGHHKKAIREKDISTSIPQEKRKQLVTLIKLNRILYSAEIEGVKIKHIKHAQDRIEERLGDTKSRHYNKETKQYTPERQKLHEEIESKWVDKPGTEVPAGEQPTIILIGGTTASGKTEVILSKIDQTKYVYLNADDMQEKLPEYHKTNANTTHEEAGDMFDEAKNTALRQHKNIILDATLKNTEKAKAGIRLYKKLGYKVILYGTQKTPENAAKQAVIRAIIKHRIVPNEYILEHTETINKSVRELAIESDEYHIYDTNIMGGKLISEGVNNEK